MGEQRWFYRNDAEWAAIVEGLKLTACPHCKVVGRLNRHGALYGFDAASGKRTLRARRVFCSNRNNRQARRGCGRTFSIWVVEKIRRLSVTASLLWQFLAAALACGVRAAIPAGGCLSERSWYHIWKRFERGQSKIRTALYGHCPPLERPPPLPANPARQSAAEVVEHLKAAFAGHDSPIAAFQHTMHAFFI